MRSRFDRESDLTDFVVEKLPIWEALGYSDWRGWGAFEFEGLFGVPDLVLACGRSDRLGRPILRTLAFEMKLRDWRRALVQAFRYRAFAQCSYVVMDAACIRPALACQSEFARTGIGLIGVDRTSSLSVHIRARVRTPYEHNLRARFAEVARSQLYGAQDTNAHDSRSWERDFCFGNEVGSCAAAN